MVTLYLAQIKDFEKEKENENENEKGSLYQGPEKT